MSDYPQYTPENAPEKSKPLLKKAQSNFGFIPNLLATQAESPVLLESYMTLAGIYGKASLSAAERQVVMMTSNRLNGCQYCMAAHTTLARNEGVAEDVIESLRNNTPFAEAKLNTLKAFTIAMVEKRGWVSEDDMQAMFDAGYSKEALFEVVVGVGLKVLSNYTNRIANTPVDNVFEPNAWTDPDR